MSENTLQVKGIIIHIVKHAVQFAVEGLAARFSSFRRCRKGRVFHSYMKAPGRTLTSF